MMRFKNALINLLSNYNYSRGNISTVDLIPMGSTIIYFTMEIRAKAYFVKGAFTLANFARNFALS
jgi:hypothetical protein